MTARSAATLLANALNNLDPAFHPLRPLLAGMAAVTNKVEVDGDSYVAAGIPATSAGVWLDLLVEGFGLTRQAGEADAALRDRLAADTADATTLDIKAAVDALLTAPDECQVVEGWAAIVYDFDDADPGYEEHVTDLYSDEDTLLVDGRCFFVVCPEGLGEALELSICATVAALRAVGISAYVLFEDGLEPVAAYPWELA